VKGSSQEGELGSIYKGKTKPTIQRDETIVLAANHKGDRSTVYMMEAPESLAGIQDSNFAELVKGKYIFMGHDADIMEVMVREETGKPTKIMDLNPVEQYQIIVWKLQQRRSFDEWLAEEERSLGIAKENNVNANSFDEEEINTIEIHMDEVHRARVSATIQEKHIHWLEEQLEGVRFEIAQKIALRNTDSLSDGGMLFRARLEGTSVGFGQRDEDEHSKCDATIWAN